jgi:16S rRNA (cytosine967-C5)-methyltransferase
MGLIGQKAQPRRSASTSNRSSSSASKPSGKTIPGLEARARAADLLFSVTYGGTSLDGAFDHGGDGDADAPSGSFASADRALTQTLVMSALRTLPSLDAALAACLDKPLNADAGLAMAILRIMAVQLLVLDISSHAAVSIAVDDAARRQNTRRLKGLVNAVGRRLVRQKEQFTPRGPRHDLPAWLAQRWLEIHGQADLAAMAEVMATQPAIDLAVKQPADMPALMDELAAFAPLAIGGQTIRLEKPGAIPRLPGFAQGRWWVQDVAATLPAVLLLQGLTNQRDAQVLDLCAAPGGKSAQLAAAGAQVTALDQSANRMARLEANMSRLGLMVKTIIADALDHQPAALFDAVLLDAPCTATGTLRRHPDIGYLRGPGDIAQMAKLQRALLEHAATMVRPGGLLVFATCSLEPEEGEDQVKHFLGKHPDWRIAPADPSAFPPACVQADGCLRTLPHRGGTTPDGTAWTGMDGFFAVALRAPA